MMYRLTRSIAALVIAVLAVSANAQTPAVKQSASGICHPPESSWYDRTSTFTSYDSIEACLDAGGRLPRGLSLRDIRAERNPASDYRPYDRDAFRHWIDVDGDCQDMRSELLILRSKTPPRFADQSRQCRVVSGQWVSPFTGETLKEASEVQIEHVVALEWAWERGAWEWSGEQRERFANHSVNLMIVEGHLNASKGSRAPDEWLPPANQCRYVARFSRVVNLYDLAPAPDETEWIKAFLERCQAN